MLNKSSYSLGSFDFSYSLDKEPPKCLDISHCHDTYEILYVIDGAGRMVVEGTLFDINQVRC